MTKFTIREGLCGSTCVGLKYKMVESPVRNRVRLTVYCNWYFIVWEIYILVTGVNSGTIYELL